MPRRTTQDQIMGHVICVLLGFAVAGLSHNLRFNNLQEGIANQIGFLHGLTPTFNGAPGAHPDWCNRIMFPAVLAFVSNSTWLGQTQSYIFLRLITAIIAFEAFDFAVNAEARIGWRVEAGGLGVLALTLVASFAQPWPGGGDFLEVAFAAGFLWASMSKRRFVLLLFALAAATNRQSAAFAGVIWIAAQAFDQAGRPIMKEIVYGAITSVLAYAAVILMRYTYCGPGAAGLGVDFGMGVPSILFNITSFIHHPTPYSWPVLLILAVVPAVLWIVANARALRPIDIRLLGAGAVLFLVTFAFASIGEINPFLTSFVILIYVAVIVEGLRQGEATVSPVVHT